MRYYQHWNAYMCLNVCLTREREFDQCARLIKFARA